MSKSVGSISFGQGTEAVRQIEKALKEFEKVIDGNPNEVISPLLGDNYFEKATKQILLDQRRSFLVKHFFGEERIVIHPLVSNSEFRKIVNDQKDRLVRIERPTYKIEQLPLPGSTNFSKVKGLIQKNEGRHFRNFENPFWQTLFLLVINPRLGRELLGFAIEEGKCYFIATETEDNRFIEYAIERQSAGYGLRAQNVLSKSQIEYSKNCVYIYCGERKIPCPHCGYHETIKASQFTGRTCVNCGKKSDLEGKKLPE